ncbi:MAG: protein kinase [Chitinophagaceae bacterium]
MKLLGDSQQDHIVRITDAAVPKNGNSFYVEMDLVEGPDLQKLLQTPNDLILSLKETLRLAEQICIAIEYCHRMKVLHGDIKTSNIKRKRDTGKYMLVDFGMGAMTDQQLRSSLHNPASLPYFAPEEEKGKILFQTDIYRFGLVLFRVLAGRFPLKKTHDVRSQNTLEAGEKKRNDLLSGRLDHIPAIWSAEEKKRESLVPAWLINLVIKCLETDPEKRFADGGQLLTYFNNKGVLPDMNQEPVAIDTDKLLLQNQQLLLQKKNLKQLFRNVNWTIRLCTASGKKSTKWLCIKKGNWKI